MGARRPRPVGDAALETLVDAARSPGHIPDGIAHGPVLPPVAAVGGQHVPPHRMRPARTAVDHPAGEALIGAALARDLVRRRESQETALPPVAAESPEDVSGDEVGARRPRPVHDAALETLVGAAVNRGLGAGGLPRGLAVGVPVLPDGAADGRRRLGRGRPVLPPGGGLRSRFTGIRRRRRILRLLRRILPGAAGLIVARSGPLGPARRGLRVGGRPVARGRGGRPGGRGRISGLYRSLPPLGLVRRQ